MQHQRLLVTAALLVAFGIVLASVSLTNSPEHASAGPSTPTATPCAYPWEPDPNGPGCRKVTQTPTPSHTPCPTDTGPDPIHGGCIPITPTPVLTPCPTNKVADSYHGSGCGTPT